MSPDAALTVSLAMAIGLLTSFLVVWLLERPGGRWSTTLRSRFLLGVPWGTLVTVLFVLAIYLFVQGGYAHWYHPVTVAFASWSYLYPLGVLAAPFSHNGPAHIVGNLIGALAFAPIAEYAWGHYPTNRGASAFSSLRTNPYVRAFVAFPLAAVAVGLLTSLFSWGPLIGFSGVVFAFAGFALIRHPIGVVVALSAQGALTLLYNAVRKPVVTASAGPNFTSPGWADIAIQGHVLGLLLGVLLGVLVLGRRKERPSALRLWSGTALFAVSLSLWAVYWFEGGSTYVLYRGWGVVLVLGLATLVSVAARATDRPLFAGLDRRRLDAVVYGLPAVVVAVVAVVLVFAGGVDLPIRLTGAALTVLAAGLLAVGVRTDSNPPFGGLTRRQAAVVLICFPILVMSFVAVPLNARALQSGGVPGGGPAVSVGDYTVTYAENVQNQMVHVLNVSAFGQTTQVNTSGVIVVSQRRDIWERTVSKGRLAYDGQAQVDLGGPGWRKTVFVRRVGWSVIDGGTAYEVWMRPQHGNWTHVYSSTPVTAGVVLDGMNVSIVPMNRSFHVAVSRNGSVVGSARLPEPKQEITVAGITFDRTGDHIAASRNGTVVTVASKETYG